MPLKSIGKNYRHIKRYREIIGILVKHGFGEFINRTRINKILNLGKRLIAKIKGQQKVDTPSYSIWERIRMSIEELGPTFIKVGQAISNRTDVLPAELITELVKLQDAVPPFDSDDAIAMVETELGRKLKEIFADFEKIPEASASIAQVHKATLHDSTTVAVKIQRPNIEKIFTVDIEIMLHLASLFESYIKDGDLINPVGVLQEFERTVKKELSFINEKNNIKRFATNFKENSDIYVPKVFDEYSTQRVLTMEFIHGVKLSGNSNLPAYLAKQGLDAKIIARRGVELVLTQVFDNGFFHADPHPGNILILPDNVICFLDFGMMGYVSDKQTELFGDIIIYIVNKDYKKLTYSILKLTDNYCDRMDELENQVAEMVEYYYHQQVSDIDVHDMLMQFIQLITEYKLKIPANLYLIVKSLVTIQGISLQLDSDFDFAELAKPYAKKILKERLSIKRIIKDASITATDFAMLLRDLPSDIKMLTDMAKRGKLIIDLDKKSSHSIGHSLDKASGILALSVILAAIIIGSAMIVLSGIPPIWKDIPIIGIGGFFISGIIGFWLLIIIIRDRFFG